MVQLNCYNFIANFWLMNLQNLNTTHIAPVMAVAAISERLFNNSFSQGQHWVKWFASTISTTNEVNLQLFPLPQICLIKADEK